MWKQILRDKVIVSIRSKQNPTIQSLIKLRDKRALRDEKQVFLIEGFRELIRISPYISTSTSSQNEMIEPSSSPVRRFTINELYYCMTLFKNESGYLYSYSYSYSCLLYTSPSPRDGLLSRMPSSA